MLDGMKKILCGLFFLVLFFSTYGQSVNDLRKEREKTRQEIDYINNLLKETDQNTKTSISRLTMLEKKIRLLT
jgi:hypothetical protein